MEAVPRHLVDSHVVRAVCVEELTGVCLRAHVNFALLCAHQEQVVFLQVEVESCAAACMNLHKNIIDSLTFLWSI